MSPLEVGALFIAAILAGALNSVAGGGSFITFPMLVLTGVPEINANVTNTVALWPGSLASVGAYRNELNTHRRILVMLGTVSLIGGILGAVLLLNTPQATFKAMVPFLLLFATLLFTFGSTVTKRLRVRPGSLRDDQQKADVPAWGTLAGIAAIQFGTSIYGGFFGGGIGIVMLATLSLMGMENIHEMNALKTLLAVLINGVAVVIFAFNGAVYWPQGILMVVGAIIGGYGGAYYARRLDPRVVRRFVIVVGFTMTAYFFLVRR